MKRACFYRSLMTYSMVSTTAATTNKQRRARAPRPCDHRCSQVTLGGFKPIRPGHPQGSHLQPINWSWTKSCCPLAQLTQDRIRLLQERRGHTRNPAESSKFTSNQNQVISLSLFRLICGSSSSWGGEVSMPGGLERRWTGGQGGVAPLRRRRRPAGVFLPPPFPLPPTPSDLQLQTDTLQKNTDGGL